MEAFDGMSIKCVNCGGVMYADQKSASYQCPYCGSSVPGVRIITIDRNR